jgi:large subunit ribosomal protein L15
MDLQSLQKITAKSKKRVGLGHGSGRGKTSGRGMKGQKARGDVPLDFEGGALPLMKRLPFLRGKGRNNSIRPEPFILNLTQLAVYKAGDTVNVDSLVKNKLVDSATLKNRGVKILGNGELSVALTVQVPVSKSASEKIQKAGGKVA